MDDGVCACAWGLIKPFLPVLLGLIMHRLELRVRTHSPLALGSPGRHSLILSTSISSSIRRESDWGGERKAGVQVEGGEPIPLCMKPVVAVGVVGVEEANKRDVPVWRTSGVVGVEEPNTRACGEHERAERRLRR